MEKRRKSREESFISLKKRGNKYRAYYSTSQGKEGERSFSIGEKKRGEEKEKG